MNKIITLIMLLGGVALIIYGISASQGFAARIATFFTGSPTDTTIWSVIAGIALILLALVRNLRGAKSSL